MDDSSQRHGILILFTAHLGLAMPTFLHACLGPKFRVHHCNTIYSARRTPVKLRMSIVGSLRSARVCIQSRCPLLQLSTPLFRGFSSRTPATHATAAWQGCLQHGRTVAAVPTTTTSLIYSRHSTTKATKGDVGEFKLVYTGPLKGAVRALKIFSLSTAVLASCGGPVLVWLGKESVPVPARVALCSLVLLVGLSTTALLHWLLKGYITHFYYHPDTERVAAYTLSLLARRVRNEFELSEMKPPTGLAGFSTFQALDKSYFMHTEVFPDKQLLSGLLDAHKNNKRQD